MNASSASLDIEVSVEREFISGHDSEASLHELALVLEK